FAFDELRAAGRANAAFARVRQLDALLVRSVDDVLLALFYRELPRRAIDDDGDLAFGLPRRRLRWQLVLVLRDACREELDLDPRLREAARLQRLRHGLHHSVWTADERSVDVGEVDPVCKERFGLLLVDAPIENRDVLRFAAHHVDEIETFQVAILEIGQ